MDANSPGREAKARWGKRRKPNDPHDPSPFCRELPTQGAQ